MGSNLQVFDLLGQSLSESKFFCCPGILPLLQYSAAGVKNGCSSWNWWLEWQGIAQGSSHQDLGWRQAGYWVWCIPELQNCSRHSIRVKPAVLTDIVPEETLDAFDGHFCPAIGLGMVSRRQSVLDSPDLEQILEFLGGIFQTSIARKLLRHTKSCKQFPVCLDKTICP